MVGIEQRLQVINYFLYDQRKFKSREVAVAGFSDTSTKLFLKFVEELSYLFNPLFHLGSPKSLLIA